MTTVAEEGRAGDDGSGGEGGIGWGGAECAWVGTWVGTQRVLSGRDYPPEPAPEDEVWALSVGGPAPTLGLAYPRHTQTHNPPEGSLVASGQVG